MSEDAVGGLVERARDAVARGEWQNAFDLMVEADADGPLSPADLAVLGEVAYAAGDLDVAIESWERAHAACIQAGDHVAAAGAAVRVAMHLLFDTALMAPVRGWLARADRLLEGAEGTPAHAWLGVVRAYERMLSGDVPGARQWARHAIEVGSSCNPAACAIGRIAEARLLILDGNVQRGLALLDEAGVATVSGELDALSTGVVYCELVCALQGLALYDEAEQWTEAMERWCEKNAIGSLHGRCRVHRAEILRLRGSCDEAQRNALMACEELRPYLRRELGWPLNELGRIRLHLGDIAGAEDALLAAHRAGWDPQPVLALVRLSQGDVAAAVASIRDALERPLRVPSKERPPNTDLQRAPLLEAQVRIAIASGDIDRARSAADELQLIADRFESKALIAGAAHARGRVRLADGDAAGAERSLSDAVRLWNEVGAPYETALARLDLADAHHASGSEQRADLERQAARTMLEAIEATPSAPADSDALHERPVASANVFRREGDYWMVNFDESTVRVRDLKGMHYLALLLADPGREYHVLDLVATETSSVAQRKNSQASRLPQPALGDAGAMLDARAKDAYRRRLAEIDDDIEQAQTIGDAERAAQADAERDFLLRELSHAVGLSGRDRRAASASERARAGVTRAVRQAITRIAEHHPQLGEHLNHTIRTGTYCAYMPDPRAPRRMANLTFDLRWQSSALAWQDRARPVRHSHSQQDGRRAGDRDCGGHTPASFRHSRASGAGHWRAQRTHGGHPVLAASHPRRPRPRSPGPERARTALDDVREFADADRRLTNGRSGASRATGHTSPAHDRERPEPRCPRGRGAPTRRRRGSGRWATVRPMRRLFVGGALALVVSVSAAGPVSADPSNAPSSITFPDVFCVNPQFDIIITDFVVNGQGRSGAHIAEGIVHPLSLEVYEVLDNGVLVLVPEESFIKNNVDKADWFCAGQVTLDSPEGPVTVAFLARATIS